MLHISYRRFCSVQCTAHRERERYLGWYGTAQPQEYSGVRQAWPRQRQSDCYTYSRERLWCLEDPRRLQNDAAPDPDHRTSTGERAASFRAQAREPGRHTPRLRFAIARQPHHPVARSHKTRRRTTAHTTRAHRGSSVRCLHAQATSPSLRRSARASSKSLARY